MSAQSWRRGLLKVLIVTGASGLQAAIPGCPPEFAAAGHEVEVLTHRPHDRSGPGREPFMPTPRQVRMNNPRSRRHATAITSVLGYIT